MSENIEAGLVCTQALYDYETHRVPTRELSPGIERHFLWVGANDQHRVPIKWLAHYASAFHFSDEELLAARTTDDMPQACGVYFLFDDEACIYVGQSQNFAIRSEQHERRGMRWTSHTYFEVPKSHAQDVEAYYIRRINPPLNNHYPRLTTFSDMVRELGLDRST